MTSQYMPFFREGRLCLPQATCELLKESGLDGELIHRASQGLQLDDDRQLINIIHQHLQDITNAVDPEIRNILASPDVEYMLTNAI